MNTQSGAVAVLPSDVRATRERNDVNRCASNDMLQIAVASRPSAVKARSLLQQASPRFVDENVVA